MIRWPSYGACLDFKNDLAETDKVDVIVAAQWPAFVLNAAGPLAFKRDLPLAEFDLERILVEDLEKSRPETPMHFLGGADNGEGSWVLRRRRQIEHVK